MFLSESPLCSMTATCYVNKGFHYYCKYSIARILFLIKCINHCCLNTDNTNSTLHFCRNINLNFFCLNVGFKVRIEFVRITNCHWLIISPSHLNLAPLLVLLSGVLNQANHTHCELPPLKVTHFIMFGPFYLKYAVLHLKRQWKQNKKKYS